MALIELVNTSLMVVVFVNCGLVNPVTAPAGKQEAVQVKLPPVTSGARATLNVAPEQIGNGGVLVR